MLLKLFYTNFKKEYPSHNTKFNFYRKVKLLTTKCQVPNTQNPVLEKAKTRPRKVNQVKYDVIVYFEPIAP